MDLIEARITPYGGRGYFSKKEIHQGTVVLRCDHPFASNIFRRFKKEVCAYCFEYNGGKTLKFRLLKAKSKGGAYAGLYFCSQMCVDQWIKYEDGDGLLSETLQLIDSAIVQTQPSPPNNNESETEIIIEKVDVQTTKSIDDIWLSKVETVCMPKEMKISTAIPALDEIEHDIARLVVVVLVKKFRSIHSNDKSGILAQKQWEEFASLQSNEYSQVMSYPPYLTSYLKTFEFLYRILPPTMKSIFTDNVVRETVGKEAGNAFGIWELPLYIESECFGTSLHPLASFFNHQCEPTVKKERIGRSMIFTALRDIPIGQELFISYGMLDDQSYQQRAETLRSQWHFDCTCPKCKLMI